MMEVEREKILNSIGDFSWDFGNKFFVEIEGIGNFIWSDPDYNGDNTFRKTNESFQQYSKGAMFRDKGKHEIRRYCGDKIVIS